MRTLDSIAFAGAVTVLMCPWPAAAHFGDALTQAAIGVQAYERSADRCFYEPIVGRALDRLREHYAQAEPYRWRRAVRESVDTNEMLRSVMGLVQQGSPYTADPRVSGPPKPVAAPADRECSASGLAVGSALPFAGSLIGFDPQLFSEANRLTSGKGRLSEPADANAGTPQDPGSTANLTPDPSSRAASPLADLAPSNGKLSASSRLTAQANEPERPLLGVQLQKVSIENGVVSSVGIRIVKITPHTPAERACLQVNDLVVILNDRFVVSYEAFAAQLREIGVGGEARLEVLRAGNQRLKMSATLMRIPDVGSRDFLIVNAQSPMRGATLVDILPGATGQAGGNDDKVRSNAVVVESFPDSSEAARAGFHRGDVITAVNDIPVASVTTLNDLLNTRPTRWVISVDRGAQHLKLGSD